MTPSARSRRPAALVLALLLCAGLLPASALAQSAPGTPEAPVPGVVWDAPDDDATAWNDLSAMRASGVRAVRTRLVPERFLAMADTLGLAVYQDLGLTRLGAEALADTTAYAERVLRLALDRAAPHASARHFGLADYVDSSDSEACAYFDALRTLAAEHAAAGTQLYYTTPFARHDRCAGAVDFVLLDALDADDPLARVRRWREAHPETPAGLARVGTWAAAGAGRGLDVPHSRERQARYLEQTFEALRTDTSGVPVFFVHRWRDGDDALAGRHYGLFDGTGRGTPARRVVAGAWTGEQPVFAFVRGTPPGAPTPWTRLLGWTVLVGLALLYALAPRLRHMVPRYFLAHGFYRDGLRGRRDVLTMPTAILLAVFAGCMGLGLGHAVRGLRETPAFELALSWLTPGAAAVAARVLDAPVMLAVILASLWALAIIAWTFVLLVAARRRLALFPAQAFMLVVWPHWPLVLVLLATMVLSSLAGPTAVLVSLGLLGACALVSLLASVRVVRDFHAVTAVTRGLAPVLLLVSPTIVSLIAAAVLALWFDQRAEFLLHLALRS